MRARYINELADGVRVDNVFAMRGKELRTARNGDAYLWTELCDRTGSIPAVFFRPSSEALAVPSGSIVRCRGVVGAYRGVKRVTAESIVAAEVWDPTDFLAVGTRAIEDLKGEFRRIVREVSEPELQRLLTRVFSTGDVFERFANCPGSCGEHHAYIGGLIEHTLGVAALCGAAASQHAGVDTDLLMTAALLHDVGLVDGLQFDTSIRVSEEGRLIGHAALGARRLNRAACQVKLDAPTEMRLEHAVLAHHSKPDGGLLGPSTIEALILQHADALDSQANRFAALVTGPMRADETWTSSQNVFNRSLCASRSTPSEFRRAEPATRDHRASA